MPMCCSEDQAGTPPQADGNVPGAVSAWGHPKLGFSHLTLSPTGRGEPSPCSSHRGFPPALLITSVVTEIAQNIC